MTPWQAEEIRSAIRKEFGEYESIELVSALDAVLAILSEPDADLSTLATQCNDDPYAGTWYLNGARNMAALLKGKLVFSRALNDDVATELALLQRHVFRLMQRAQGEQFQPLYVDDPAPETERSRA